MRYGIRHVTTYRYGAPVTFAQCTLVLTPHAGAGQQVEDCSLELSPKPSTVTTHRAFFGHDVCGVQIDTPHRELKITATATVAVDRRSPSESGRLADTPPWQRIRMASQGEPSLAPDAPAHFLFPSPHVPFAGVVSDYVAESFRPEAPILEAAGSIIQRIHADFRYAPEATHVTTPLLEAFEKRHGVCQDYAHILIAGLRGLGLPARYVSGYLRTLPPPGQPRLEGADATHAWVDLWCGPNLGWVGLDPTNAIFVGSDHVVLATGRDYADVAPVGGVLIGSADQTVKVNVDVVPLSDPPNTGRTTGSSALQ